MRLFAAPEHRTGSSRWTLAHISWSIEKAGELTLRLGTHSGSHLAPPQTRSRRCRSRRVRTRCSTWSSQCPTGASRTGGARRERPVPIQLNPHRGSTLSRSSTRRFSASSNNRRGRARSHRVVHASVGAARNGQRQPRLEQLTWDAGLEDRRLCTVEDDATTSSTRIREGDPGRAKTCPLSGLIPTFKPSTPNVVRLPGCVDGATSATEKTHLH
jgi:hypothetical protein